jgi:hypothetical protein
MKNKTGMNREFDPHEREEIEVRLDERRRGTTINRRMSATIDQEWTRLTKAEFPSSIATDTLTEVRTARNDYQIQRLASAEAGIAQRLNISRNQN